MGEATWGLKFFRRAVMGLLILGGSVQAQTVVDGNLTVETVKDTGTLSQPTCMVFLADDDLLVGEKGSGQVKRVLNGVVQGTIAVDLNVANNSERGLLGMALDPQFTSNSLVYIFYTASSTGGDSSSTNEQRISRFTWNGSTLTSEDTITTLPATGGPNHDGGKIVFGPPSADPADQKLFAIIGDLNRNNQNENYSAGSPPDGSGCVIRVNPDGSIPTDGPFFGVAGGNTDLERMYAYGIRNSFGLCFDPLTDALWQSENGPGNPNTYDEVNRIDPAFNSGWESHMGPLGGPGTDQGTAAALLQFSGVGNYSDPEFSWRLAVAPTAIGFATSATLLGSGFAATSGTLLGPAYRDNCFVGCNNTGELFRFVPNGARDGFVLTGTLADLVFDQNGGDSDAEIVFGNSFNVVTDIKTGPDGALYVLSLTAGQIYRIYDPGLIPIELSAFELF